MILLDAQHALRKRFEEFRLASRRENRTAAAVALGDFEHHLRRWTEAGEQALIPAVQRAELPGRDVRRELRLEYVQLRELTRFIVQQIHEGIRLNDLIGYIENLDGRLRAHESGLKEVYFPAAETTLTDAEWEVLRAAVPPE